MRRCVCRGVLCAAWRTTRFPIAAPQCCVMSCHLRSERSTTCRKDAYSRRISGLSPGGICAFTAAWLHPDQFSRMVSWIGSFTWLQREPKRNLRVWLQDGAGDRGMWPFQNLEIANSLTMRGYDLHFSFGRETHCSAQGSAEFPQPFVWLWRDTVRLICAPAC